MDEKEALELIDAHLDGETLTDVQAQALSDWIRENEQQADAIFRRIFLHTFLRRRIQSTMLLTDIDSAREIRDSPSALLGDANGDRRSRRWMTWSILVLAFLLVGGLTYQAFFGPVPQTSRPFAYEGFDYEGLESEDVESPTIGGLQGANGGFGFATPWIESGEVEAVVETDPLQHASGMHDMRQFAPLGYTDLNSRTLQVTGRQLRSSGAGKSVSERKLDVSAAPESLRDGEQLGADGSTVWVSFLAQSYDEERDSRFALVQLGSQKAGIRIGRLHGAPHGKWAAAALLNGHEVNVKTSQRTTGEVVFVVMKIDFRPGVELATIWMDPPLRQTPADETKTLQLQLPDFRFDTIYLKAIYSTDFDELRFGDTFRDVAPIAP
ncbi:hypothetical protein [Blastopirellula marina]|uniref:Uncharacterized protein n=1 Tax=Blastopirellula marina DSM 3645 TaxID=314230 RepID=A3ZRQ0_9BACT|nr:hypothetical protein [Blastopirellula marina]EAQ80819.1 hypothetical protein DSM3645_12401 [Blastopirellula marina DSM 3645]